MTLTPEQIWFFEHNGFVVLPYRLPESTVEKIRQVVLRDIEAAKEPIGHDEDGNVHRLSNILDRDPIFWETATDPGLLDGLESLIGPNIEVIRNRHNHVMLRTARGGHVYMHRDAFNWTASSVSVIMYLEETNLDNGCTEVVPGTNHLPYAELPLEENEKILRSGLLDQHVRVPMPSGGILALNSNDLSQSGAELHGAIPDEHHDWLSGGQRTLRRGGSEIDCGSRREQVSRERQGEDGRANFSKGVKGRITLWIHRVLSSTGRRLAASGSTM